VPTTFEPLLSSPTRRFPPAVERRLAERRSHHLAALEGDVLDLARPDARHEVNAVASGAAVEHRYDGIVSVASLVFFPDLLAAVRAIDQLLAPQGVLGMVEPTHHHGMTATALATAWACHPVVRDLHVERDVPRTVRATGLTITDLERFEMPTSIFPLRRFVDLRATRIHDRPDGDR
jgi:SAM-dependent methyltransferase